MAADAFSLALPEAAAGQVGLLRACSNAAADGPVQVFQQSPSGILVYDVAAAPLAPATLFTRAAAAVATSATETNVLCACINGQEGLVCVQGNQVFLRADRVSMGSGRAVFSLPLDTDEVVTCLCAPPSQPDYALFAGTNQGRVLFAGVSGNDHSLLFCETVVPSSAAKSLLPSVFSSFLSSTPSPIVELSFCAALVVALSAAGGVFIFDPVKFNLVAQHTLPHARAALVPGAHAVGVLVPDKGLVYALALHAAPVAAFQLPAEAAFAGKELAGAVQSETSVYVALREPAGLELVVASLADSAVERRTVAGARSLGLAGGDHRPVLLTSSHVVVFEPRARPMANQKPARSGGAVIGAMHNDELLRAMDAPVLSAIHVPALLQGKLATLKAMLDRVDWSDEHALLVGESLLGLVACPPSAFEDVSKLHARLDALSTDDLVKTLAGSLELYALLPDVVPRPILLAQAAPLLFKRFAQRPTLRLAEFTLEAFYARHVRVQTEESERDLQEAKTQCIDRFVATDTAEAHRLSVRFLHFDGLMRTCSKMGAEGAAALDALALKSRDCELLVNNGRVVARRTGLALVSGKDGFAFAPAHDAVPPKVDLGEVMHSDCVELAPVGDEGAVYVIDARTGRALGVDPATQRCVFVEQVHDWAYFPGFALDFFCRSGNARAALDMAARLNLASVLVDVLERQRELGIDRGDLVWVAMLAAKRMGDACAVLQRLGDAAQSEDARETYAGLAELASRVAGTAGGPTPLRSTGRSSSQRF